MCDSPRLLAQVKEHSPKTTLPRDLTRDSKQRAGGYRAPVVVGRGGGGAGAAVVVAGGGSAVAEVTETFAFVLVAVALAFVICFLTLSKTVWIFFKAAALFA